MQLLFIDGSGGLAESIHHREDLGIAPREENPLPVLYALGEVGCREPHIRSGACAYQVAYEINPHMRPGAVRVRVAHAQHRRLARVLEQEGASLLTLPYVHGAPDSVFVKDNAVLTLRRGVQRALMCTMRFPERCAEQQARADALARLGFEVVEGPTVPFEGGDVVRLPNGDALLGYGLRSHPRAAHALSAFLGAEVTPLRLIDPALYHLDTALTVLSDGTALVCREAFAGDVCAVLRRVNGVRAVVPIPKEEALRFGLNLVEVFNAVVIGSFAPTVMRVLKALGRRPRLAPLTQFQLAGGSAACLVSRIFHEPRAGRTLVAPAEASL